MGKLSSTAKGGSRRWQAMRRALAALTFVTCSAFYKVSATTMQRVLPPDELLLHGQFRHILIDTIAHRSDPSADGYAMDVDAKRGAGHQHALEALLSGAQGRQSKQFAMTGDRAASAIMERNLVDLDEQVTAGRTTQVLYGNHHRQWATDLYQLVPLVDERDGQDNAPGTHALVEILHDQPQIVDRDDIGLSGALIHLGGDLQSLSGDAVRLPRRVDSNLGKPDAVNGSFKPFAGLLEAYQKADRADQGEQNLRPGEKCYLPGPLGCSPLSAKIGSTLVCGLIAWGLIFRIFVLLDRRRRNWLLILPLGLVATVLYLLPCYLVVGFPWNW